MKTKILQKTLLTLIPGFAALLVATTANAQNLVALQGDLHQTTLVSQTCNGGVCDSVFEGSGTVNIMGPMTWTVHATQDFNGYPCNPTVVESTFVGATGSITIVDTLWHGLSQYDALGSARLDRERLERHWRVLERSVGSSVAEPIREPSAATGRMYT